MSTRVQRAVRRTAPLAAVIWALSVPIATAATSSVPAPSSPPGQRTGPAPLEGVDGPNVIAEQYIVVLKKGSTAEEARLARLDASNQGGRVQRQFGAALSGFAARLPARALDALRRNSRVEFIEADAVYRSNQTGQTESPAPWGLDRIDQRALPLSNAFSYAATGSTVRAYVIDTGIRSTHADLRGRVAPGYTAFSDGMGTEDCYGHGTHVAGTIGGTVSGVAKQVQLVPVRTLDCTGSGSISGIIGGIDWVTANHQAGQPAVANMSLGGGVSTALDSAVTNSIADGITYVVAAGNSSADACGSSPARVAAAITVGATTNTDARASFSNYGTCLDVFAPGESVVSSWYTSDTATATSSGTSMASPHVAGVAALLLQASPSVSPSAIRDTIVNGATANVVAGAGAGSPNRLVFSAPGSAGTPVPTVPACSLPEKYSGALAGSGAFQNQPNGTYFSAGGGTYKGCLRGPTGADFDLYLLKWNGSTWVTVAQGISQTQNEDVTYTGTVGLYLWRVASRTGAGSYTFAMQRP